MMQVQGSLPLGVCPGMHRESVVIPMAIEMALPRRVLRIHLQMQPIYRGFMLNNIRRARKRLLMIGGHPPDPVTGPSECMIRKNAASYGAGTIRNAFDPSLHLRDEFSWTALISRHVKRGQGRHALKVYEEMQEQGVKPSTYTFVAALKACSSLQDLVSTRKIHVHVVQSGLELDEFVATMLVDVYAKCGSLVDARNVFDRMPRRDVVAWSAMILGYAQMEEGELALQLFAQMQQEGVVPNERTFVVAIKACGSIADLKRGKEIYFQVSQRGLAANSFVARSLIDMYGKCGSMVDAQQVFDGMPKRELGTWSALIAGYARQGEIELIFRLLQKMQEEGVQPHGITFLGVLAVCKDVGLVDQGQKFFESMRKDYGIIPTIEHYTCMVDLLGRAGQMDKLMEMVKTMPFPPDGPASRRVLAACGKWTSAEVGLKPQ